MLQWKEHAQRKVEVHPKVNLQRDLSLLQPGRNMQPEARTYVTQPTQVGSKSTIRKAIPGSSFRIMEKPLKTTQMPVRKEEPTASQINRMFDISSRIWNKMLDITRDAMRQMDVDKWSQEATQSTSRICRPLELPMPPPVTKSREYV